MRKQKAQMLKGEAIAYVKKYGLKDSQINLVYRSLKKLFTRTPRRLKEKLFV